MCAIPSKYFFSSVSLILDNIVGLLIEVGEGKIKSEEVIDIIAKEDRTASGICAPACGLYLKDVYY